MVRVILESPFVGDVVGNIEYARACLRDCLLRGEAPIASYLLYTQPGVLDDTNPEERKLGIEAGLLWGALAEKTVVYTDRGISRGMQEGIKRAEAEGRPVEYRSLFKTAAERFFWEARLSSRKSNCLKTQTGAVLVKNGEIISRGNNVCAPEGHRYGEKLVTCPRMQITTGANYELCKPVHAEVMTLLNVRKNRAQEEIERFPGHISATTEEIFSAFTKEELVILNSATLYLVGHYYACSNCQKFAETLGVKIEFDPITAGQTKERYEAAKITEEVKP